MRTIFIGDVHGCYDELMALVQKIWLKDEDHLYFVWDLINKWPKSLEVVSYVKNRPNTWSVTWNHEFFSFPTKELLDQIDSDNLVLSDGSKKWAHIQSTQSKSLERLLSSEWYLEWLRSLPVYIEKEDFILVHWGIHPDYWMNTPVEIATMIREYQGRPWYEYYQWEKKIIYGHWAIDGLRIRKNTIGLDTGCCFGWHLTAYCIETWEYWQVRANALYKMPAHWKVEVD